MQISPEEIKRIRKILLLNLLAADFVLAAGILLHYFAPHRYQIYSFLPVILGLVWLVMTVNKMIKFRKFRSQQPSK